MTQNQAIEAVRRGERVKGKHSLHDAEKDAGPHHCRWRVLFCNNEQDVCECSVCGRQDVFRCDFDEEFA